VPGFGESGQTDPVRFERRAVPRLDDPFAGSGADRVGFTKLHTLLQRLVLFIYAVSKQVSVENNSWCMQAWERHLFLARGF
jgi:hypothetical protein